jgi:hypothetical protein
VQLFIVPGNHDIGFHYRFVLYNYIHTHSFVSDHSFRFVLRRMITKSQLSKRFEKDFNVTGVNLLNLKGNV